ncbi:hypothetical protein N9242_03395, partial [Vicingaceae bacterium]|nr:hypothetical protein [Vicingaceae bacterium]
LTFGLCFSQTELPKNDETEVCFTEVIKINNDLSENEIYENFIEWISTKSSNFNRSNSERNSQGAEVWLGSTKSNFQHVDALFINNIPLKLSDKESKKIVAKIVNKYTGATMGCIRVVYLEYDLIVKIREGRYKYEIGNFVYTHYNQATTKQSQMYGFADEGNCKSKGSLDDLLLCARCKREFEKFYSYLNTDVADFIVEMKKKIDVKSDDEDW